MTAENWIGLLQVVAAIGASVIVVWGGTRAYRAQKEVDRREQLIAKRRQTYRDLLVGVSKSITEKGPAANAAYHTAKSEAFVYGSDGVIESIKRLSDLLEGRVQGTSEDKLRAYAVLVYAMRADSFEGSRLTVDDLALLTPFN